MEIYFGENLKRFRKEKGMTQETLAEFLGLSFQAVSKWERGDTFPDITMLPTIAAFFGVTTDELLGVDSAKRKAKEKEYLDFYERMRLKDTPLTFSRLSEAVREFPDSFPILVRYMELLPVKWESSDYDKRSAEKEEIYERIQNYCTDDGIRMWAKRLMCQHLRAKNNYTGNEEYLERAEKIISEMPKMIDTGEYISTMLHADSKKHYAACSDAIEQELYMLQNTVDHYCYYEERFSPEYKIEAIDKMLRLFDMIFTDGNYGKMWHHVIYNYGHLGYLHFEIGDIENALKNLRLSAEYAKKFDELPSETQMTSQFFEGKINKKILRGKSMCERMIYRMTVNYPLSDEFKASAEFREIIDMLS